MQTSLIHSLPTILEPLELGSLFARPAPLDVELGSGDGSFIVDWAVRHPERNFLGVERLLGRLRRIDRRGRATGLENLRVVRIEAGYFLRYLLPARSVSALHLYFPDPWPKKKHARHRLVAPPFLVSLARVLVPGGAVYLRTDDASYYAQMESVFSADPGFRRVETPVALAALTTDFERGFNAQGIPTLRLAFQLAA